MSEATIQQQPPTPSNGDVWQLVIEDMKARREFGIAKYGVPVQVENGRDHLTDALQESLDLVVYLRAAIEKRNMEHRYDLAKKVRLWDAINEYVKACGGDTSVATIGERRMNAVAMVERVVESIDGRVGL